MNNIIFTHHHTAISVSDLNKSIKFYALFGFKLFKRWKSEGTANREICHLQLNDMILEIFCFQEYTPLIESSKSLKTDLPNIGVKHFGLEVQSIENAKAYINSLRIDSATEIVYGKNGLSYFFITDPDGILIEIIEDKRV